MDDCPSEQAQAATRLAEQAAAIVRAALVERLEGELTTERARGDRLERRVRHLMAVLVAEGFIVEDDLGDTRG